MMVIEGGADWTPDAVAALTAVAREHRRPLTTEGFLNSEGVYTIVECLGMSKELANRFERDLSAPEETAKRARRARSRGAALDIDWGQAFEVYYAQANLDPKNFIRFPDREVDFSDSVMTHRDFGDVSSDDDERYESATPR